MRNGKIEVWDDRNQLVCDRLFAIDDAASGIDEYFEMPFVMAHFKISIEQAEQPMICGCGAALVLDTEHYATPRYVHASAAALMACTAPSYGGS